MLNRIPQLRGMSPWILMDFRSPRRQLPGIQDGFNRKGLISDQGEKKQAFYILAKGLQGRKHREGSIEQYPLGRIHCTQLFREEPTRRNDEQ
jgi:hypothetical protein